jgi:hypothetical protein
MVAKVKDRIIVESAKAGQPPREGEILEVMASPVGARYRVRWDNGHESVIRPSAGSVRTIHPVTHRTAAS